MFVSKKKLSIVVLLALQSLQLFSLSLTPTVAEALKAKAAGNSKELVKYCSTLAGQGRLLRFRLNEQQKQQTFDACGDIFKYGSTGKKDPKKEGYKDPKAYAATAFSAPRILKAVSTESYCRDIGKDLFSLADDDFKAGVSAGRTNFIRSVCGNYFAQNANKGTFGEMNRNAYHKLDSTFWRAVKVDPVRAALLAAAKNSEGSVTRRTVCATMAGDLPTKFLNDENKRLACLVCGPLWEDKDVRAKENTCGALAYEEKAVSGDPETVEEDEEEPVKPVKKSSTTSVRGTSVRKKTVEKTDEEIEAELEEALSTAKQSRSQTRADLKKKYSK